MKTTFIVNNHSFVDVITNSSSELFVCNTEKTIDLVKDILKELLYKHNPKLNFDDCFGTIELSKYNFDENAISKEVYRNYKSLSDSPDYSDYFSPKLHVSQHKVLTQCISEESTLREKLKKRDMSLKKEQVDSFVNPEQLVFEREAELKKELSKIWKKYAQEKVKAECEMFSEFLKQNEMLNDQTKKDVEKIYSHTIKRQANHFSRHSGVFGLPEKLDSYYDIWNVFHECLFYKMKLNKNQIRISSRRDNSIPYEIFEDIESVFNARRYHLG